MNGSTVTLAIEHNVLYNNTKSDCMKITCGIPQGSILGPLLVIIYINDIVNVSSILKPILFADDTSLFHAHINFHTLIEQVNIELQKHCNNIMV